MSWSRVSRVATSSSAGPRSPPAPPSAWQLRHCLSCKTSAPCSSSGVRPLHVRDRRRQRAPRVHDAATTATTCPSHVERRRAIEHDQDDAEHRHRAAASSSSRRCPRGTAATKSRPMPTTGADQHERRLGVRRQQREDGEERQEEEVGPRRGLDDASGSGGPLGPNGPKTAAQATIASDHDAGEDDVLAAPRRERRARRRSATSSSYSLRGRSRGAPAGRASATR